MIISGVLKPLPALSALLVRAKSSLDQATETLARSFSPAADEAWLTAAQLQLYRDSTGHAAWLIPVAMFFVSQAVTPWIAPAVRITWFLTMALAAALLDLVERRLDETLPRNAKGVRDRARWFTVTNTIFLLAWCSMSVCLWAPGQIVDHMMLVLILACSLAGSLSATASHPALAITSIVVPAAFILGPTAASHDPLDRVLAGLAVVYILLLGGQFLAAHKSTSRMLRLEHERAGLVREMQAAREESERAKARAAAAGEARSQFFSHMNHELRTPMNAILGFSDIIHQKAFGQNVDTYAEYAGIIHESGKTLLAMIDNVLNLSKIQGGQMYLRESDVSLCRLLQSGIEQHEIRASDAGVELLLDAPWGLPFVRADERALKQILANLLSNAIKFTLAGGRATVFAQMEADDRIAFGVEDNGVGIAAEDQADVFERFGYGRHDVTSSDRGTGLGLAIVRGFAEAHDGEVQLESAPGRGTRVTVYLPAHRVLTPAPLKVAASA